MRETRAFCDICGKEFPPNLMEFSSFTGAVIKVDEKLKTHQARFASDYCDECTKKIIEFIEKLSNESKSK